MHKTIVASFLLFIALVSINMVFAQSEVFCGQIIRGEFSQEFEQQEYRIHLEAGASISVSGTPLGNTLFFNLVILNPIGQSVADSNGGDNEVRVIQNPRATSSLLSASGQYSILVTNVYLQDYYNWEPHPNAGGVASVSGGIGVYDIGISCTDDEGNFIGEGDYIPPTEEPIAPAVDSAPAFTGFGLPPLPAVDFSAGIEIPLALGQPQTTALAGDLVALYAYIASEGETVTLSLARASGNISIGVSVIKRENNEIVFLGGLPSSNNLSVELTFPSAGDYVIGLFALNTATLSDTSGAVTVRID